MEKTLAQWPLTAAVEATNWSVMNREPVAKMGCGLDQTPPVNVSVHALIIFPFVETIQKLLNECHMPLLYVWSSIIVSSG